MGNGGQINAEVMSEPHDLGRDTARTISTTEDRLHAILESCTDGYWEYDFITAQVQISARFLDLLGYAPDEVALTLDNWMALIHPADLPTAMETYQAHAAGQLKDYHVEHRLRAKSGEWRWVLNRGRIIEREATGAPARMVGAYIDITERKQVEAAVQQRSRELALLNQVIQGLTSTLELNEVLALVLEELRHLLEVTASSIWLIEEGTRDLLCLQATGPHSAIVRNWRVPAGTGLIGWVAQHDQSLIVADAQQDARHYWEVDRNTGLSVRSVIGVPLRSRRGVIGVIQALDEQPDRFQPNIVHLVELLATAAASAIENAQLFQETRQRADRLAVLTQISAAINQPLELNDVVQAAVRELTRALHISQTGLALFDPLRQHLIIVADVPASGSPPVFGVEIPVEGNASTEYVLATGLPLAIEDAQHDPRMASVHDLMRQRQVQSILIVPLVVRGEVIGTFGCDAVAGPHRFTQEDIDLALTVANMIAVRIEQARLFDAERTQRRLAEALRDSAAVLNQTLHFDEVLDRVLDTVGRVAPHDAANIMLIDDYGVARIVRERGYAERGLSDAARELRLKVAEVPGLHSMSQTGQSLVVYDTATDPRWIHLPPLSWERSYAGAPIRVNGCVIGFLQMTSATPQAFTQVQAEQLQAFADQAAIAIENARLYDQVQHYADELEQRVAERTHELSAAYERLKAADRVKDQFVSQVSHELRTPIANIQLYLSLLDRGKPEKHADYMHTLRQEAMRLNKMIEDLLDISHLDMGKTEFHFAPTDVNRLVATLVLERKPEALERGLTLQQNLQAKLPLVHADLTLAMQALSNLLSNALNFTPAGGLITCSTESRSYADREWVTMTVKNTGPGIAADELPHLGERFYRGRAARNYRAPGTGLGLAIGKEIIDRHGGRLTIDSEVGQGASFTIWLKPISPAQA
ncbi:MAG TPA: GAF domain-containing protein [Anaerolineae bacterium]|nr:GAF domain-containing protein [Anaerolineae bacterium]